jgi:hypothetical protein
VGASGDSDLVEALVKAGGGGESAFGEGDCGRGSSGGGSLGRCVMYAWRH